jgi:hypothetical protein
MAPGITPASAIRWMTRVSRPRIARARAILIRSGASGEAACTMLSPRFTANVSFSKLPARKPRLCVPRFHLWSHVAGDSSTSPTRIGGRRDQHPPSLGCSNHVLVSRNFCGLIFNIKNSRRLVRHPPPRFRTREKAIRAIPVCAIFGHWHHDLSVKPRFDVARVIEGTAADF